MMMMMLFCVYGNFISMHVSSTSTVLFLIHFSKRPLVIFNMKYANSSSSPISSLKYIPAVYY